MKMTRHTTEQITRKLREPGYLVNYKQVQRVRRLRAFNLIDEYTRECMSLYKKMERAKGFEPSTSTLARLRSTRLSYARFQTAIKMERIPPECKPSFFCFLPKGANPGADPKESSEPDG